MFLLSAIKLLAVQSGIFGFFAGRVIPGLEPFQEKFWFAASDNQFEPAIQMFERVRNITGFLIAGIIVISIIADLPSYIADWKSALGRSGKRYMVCTLFFVGYSAIIFPLPLWIGQGIGTAIDPDWFATGEIMRRMNTYIQPTPSPSPNPNPNPNPTPQPSPQQQPTSKNWYSNLVGWAFSLPTTGVTAIFMVLCYLIFFIVIAIICAVWLTFVVVLYVIGPIFICLGFIKGFGEKMLANYGGALIQCALWPVWMALCNAMVKNSIVTQLQYTLQPGGTESGTMGSAMISIQMVSYCAVFMVLYGMTPMVANMIFPLSSFGQMMGMVAKKATDAATMAAGVAIGAATGGTGLAPLLGGKAFMGAKAGASLTQQAGSQLASKAVSGLSSLSKSEITGAGAKLDGFDMKGAGFGKATDNDFTKLYKKGLSSFEGGGQEYLRDLAEGKTENLPSFEEAIKNGFSPETAKTINDSLAASERANGASSVRMFGANPENVPTYTESLKNGYGDNFQQQKIGEIADLEQNWNSMSNEQRAQAMRALPTYNQALRQQHDAQGASNINKNRQILESKGKMPHEDYSVKTTKDGGLLVTTPNSVMTLGSDGKVGKESRAAFENSAKNSGSNGGGHVLSSLDAGERGSSVNNGSGSTGTRQTSSSNLTSLNVGDRTAPVQNESGAGGGQAKTFPFPVTAQSQSLGANNNDSTETPAATANQGFVLNKRDESSQENNAGSAPISFMPGVSNQSAGSIESNQATNNSAVNRNLYENGAENKPLNSDATSSASLSGGAVISNNFIPRSSNDEQQNEGGNFTPPPMASSEQSSYDTNRLIPPIENPPPDKNVYIMPGTGGQSGNGGSGSTGSNSSMTEDNSPKKFDGGVGSLGGELGAASNTAPPTTNPRNDSYSNDPSFVTNNLLPLENPALFNQDSGFGINRAEDNQPNTNNDFFVRREDDSKKYEDGGAYDNFSAPSSTHNSSFAMNENTAPAKAEDVFATDDRSSDQSSGFQSSGETGHQKFDNDSSVERTNRYEASNFFPAQNDLPATAYTDTNSGSVENKTDFVGEEQFIFGLNEPENTEQAFTRNDYTSPFENLATPLSVEPSSGSQKSNEDSKVSDSKSGKKLNLADDSTNT